METEKDGAASAGHALPPAVEGKNSPAVRRLYKESKHFEGFANESDMGSKETAAELSERRRAHSQELLDALLETVNKSQDRDSKCHICVFGLMGHGKSRLLNLLLTSVSNPVSAQQHAGDDEDGHVQWTDEMEGMVRVCNEVPSGEGSTTRAYSRYLLPVHTSTGMARFPFYLVDTIGVKFTDETDPADAEMVSEFGLVRRQLAGLDFRERLGAFREQYKYNDPVSGAVVRVAGGEDVIDLHVNAKDHTAAVTLRGGHVIPGVPLSKLWDPDGKSWEFSNERGFRDKRTLFRRWDHALKGKKWWQPRCRAAILVVNPHQDVPQKVWDQWGDVFEAAGFDQVPVLSTHSDLVSIFGEDAGEFASRAWRNIMCVGRGLGDGDEEEKDLRPLLVENYSEDSLSQKRRWLSEHNALRCLIRAASAAQTEERGLDSVNQKAHHIIGSGLLVFAVYKGWRAVQRVLKR